MSAGQPDWNEGQELVWLRPTVDGLATDELKVEFVEFVNFLHAKVITDNGSQVVRWDHLRDPFYKPVEKKSVEEFLINVGQKKRLVITIMFDLS